MITLERYLGKYLTMLVHSYNPDMYVRLMEQNWRTYVKFFLATLAVALCLFTLTFIPLSLKWVGELPNALNQADTLTISGEFSANHPIEVLEVPHIVLDVNNSGADADYLISGEGVSYPTFIFFGESFVPWQDLTNLREQTTSRDRMLVGIILFLLPSILFWVAVWSVLKLVFVFLFLVMIGYTLPRFLSHRMSFNETLKTAVLAMPSVMLFGVGLAPLAPRPLWWWGLALTCGVFVIGVFLLSERTKKRRHKV